VDARQHFEVAQATSFVDDHRRVMLEDLIDRLTESVGRDSSVLSKELWHAGMLLLAAAAAIRAFVFWLVSTICA